MGKSTLLLVLLSVVSVVLPVFALQANLAGIVDWHKPLIGRPLLVPTPPRLVSDRVLAITESNVIAALDSNTGDVAWRYKLEDEDPVVSYHVQGDVVVVLSGPSASTARALSLSTGQVSWERPLHQAGSVKLTTPVHLGTDVSFTPDGESIVVLSDGRRITKLALADGKVQWGLDAPAAGDTVTFKQVLVSGDVVHTLAITNALDGLTLTTLSLSLLTSVPVSEFTQIPSFVSNPTQALLTQGAGDGSARVVWLEHGRIRSAYLSEAGQLGSTKEGLPGKGHLYESIIGESRSHGLVLGKKRNGAVQVLDVKTGKVVDEFANSHDSADKSASAYSVAEETDSVSFTRVFWSHELSEAVAETLIVGESKATVSVTFPFDTASHSVVLASTGSPGKSLLFTSSGAILLVDGLEVAWTREEALAEIAAVRFVDLAEKQVDRQVLADEDFISRITRHLVELKELPGFLLRFAQRFTGDYASSLSTPSLDVDDLHRDRFGLQKLLVAVSTAGKVFALDSSNGAIVWSRNLGLTTESGSELSVQGLWVVRQVGEDVNPTLAVIATRNRGGAIHTVGFHIDAFTGQVSGDADEKTGLPLGKIIFGGKAKTAFITPFENCDTHNRVLAVVDPVDTVHIYPSCKTVAAEIERISGDVYYSLTERTIDGTEITGYALGAREGVSFHTQAVWTFSLPGSLVSNAPVAFEGVASFGRVKGDKSTLYKYLNPHLLVLANVSPKDSTGGVSVVDTVTGRKIYEVVLSDIVGNSLRAAMTENWLVYSWQDRQGWRIASVELYEAEGGAVTPGVSSFASGQGVTAYSQIFIAPGEIKTLAFSTSKSGITAKELIYINGRDQVAVIPRPILDPRRPLGKPTSSDKEEMLIPYDPVIGPTPQRVVSHKYQVLGAKHLISSPTLMESTSLLLTYGLDLFLTRGLNPSGTFDILTDSFNKAQLLLTLAALSVGIIIARPAVARKALGAKWF